MVAMHKHQNYIRGKIVINFNEFFSDTNYYYFFLYRVQKLHQRWVALRSMLHSRLIAMLATMTFPVEERTVTRQTRTVTETRMVDTNVHFRQLQECTDWVRGKLVRLNI